MRRASSLSNRAHAAAMAAAMRDVATAGVKAARHLRGGIHEVRVDGDRHAYRLLFAPEGRGGQVLLARELAAQREAEGLTRTVVAARMGTSESAVARLEKGEADAKLSTVGRYAAALGKRVEWRIVDQAGGRSRTG